MHVSLKQVSCSVRYVYIWWNRSSHTAVSSNWSLWVFRAGRGCARGCYFTGLWTSTPKIRINLKTREKCNKVMFWTVSGVGNTSHPQKQPFLLVTQTGIYEDISKAQNIARCDLPHSTALIQTNSRDRHWASAAINRSSTCWATSQKSSNVCPRHSWKQKKSKKKKITT